MDDPAAGRAFLCRDPFGVKPLFYTLREGRLVFASEIKALFEYPGVRPVVGKEGLREIFGLGPARTPGCGVFEGIRELKPGHLAVFDRQGFRELAYFDLEAQPLELSYPEAVERVRDLLTDAVRRQLKSDVPLCTFLSGGLDSSLVTAIAAKSLGELGEKLDTYSFEFEGNSQWFRPSSFQPDRDQDWAERVSTICGTDHTTLLCTSRELADSLKEAVIAKDLPGMADVDGSLLGFCRQVKRRHYRGPLRGVRRRDFWRLPLVSPPGDVRRQTLSLVQQPGPAAGILRPEIRTELDLEGHVSQRLEETLAQVPTLPGESEEQVRARGSSAT